MPDIHWAVRKILEIAGDDSHGYDQEHRWGPDYDCSSLIITVLEQAGFPVKSKYHATYTGNMRTALTNAGFIDVGSLVDMKTGKGMRIGDICLRPNAHTEMITGVEPYRLTGAHINEKGKIMGGKKGDQTGKEISTIPYYNYPWTYIFRYVDKSGDYVEKIALEVIDGKWGNGVTRMIRLRAAGYDYNLVQRHVNEILKREAKQ